MMDRIAQSVEADPIYSARIHFTETPSEATAADALSESAAQIARTLSVKAMACYTTSGSTARRIARERPPVKTLVMTASIKVARRLGLQWGVHAVHTRDVSNFEEMVGKAKRMALRHHLAAPGDRMVIMAGVPFKTAGSTNVIHVVKLAGRRARELFERVASSPSVKSGDGSAAAPGLRRGFRGRGSRAGRPFRQAPGPLRRGATPPTARR